MNETVESQKTSGRARRWGAARQLLLGASALCILGLAARLAQHALAPPPSATDAPVTIYSAGESEEQPASTGRMAIELSQAAGFLVLVDSTPAGEVFIDGESLGTTPVSANFACKEGASLRVEVRRKGYVPAQEVLGCMKDQMATLRARLTLTSR